MEIKLMPSSHEFCKPLDLKAYHVYCNYGSNGASKAR